MKDYIHFEAEIVMVPSGNLTAGVEDYLKPVDGHVWIQAMRDESTDMPPFYPEWFGRLADRVLLDSWGMQRHDIRPENCKNIYGNLVSFCPVETCNIQQFIV